MENKKNGNVLVESLIAISITIIALSLVGKSILNYYSIQRAEEKRYKNEYNWNFRKRNKI